MRFKHFPHFILLAFVFLACQNQETADLIVTNANIYTVNDAQPKVEALAVKDGKIVFVASNEEINKWQGEGTEVLDLNGKTVIPGLIEGHGHFMGIGTAKLNLDLNNITSYQEMVDMVAKAVEKTSPGEWITGRGWHQSKWDSLPANSVNGFQTHHLLSEVSPNNPVFLRHASGHAGFANAKAMEIAGVQPLAVEKLGEEEVEGGEVMRDALGNPTGMFNERAQYLIGQHVPESNEESINKAFDLATEECLKYGITSFHDAGVGAFTIDLFKRKIDEGKMKTRLYVMLSGSDEELLDEWLTKGPEIGYGDDLLTVRSIKLYMDGALGSRGAWLLEPYTDRPGHVGMATNPPALIYQVSKKALQSGFQVCSHAIGDRMNREVLDNYEKAFKEIPDGAKDHRFRIEHAQHLNATDIPRFGELGVIPAMQAIHMSSDRPWAIDRLGKERIVEGAYMWQALLQSGVRIANGTDAPVEPLNPFASFYASVSRRTLAGSPEGGYEPAQKMTRAQALKSYTLDAAYAAFEENIKGSLEVGKLADIVILSQDIMEIPEDDILNTKVLYTIVNGKIVYQLD